MSFPLRRFLPIAIVALSFVSAADAEKADRLKPLNVEADLPSKIDLLRQFVTFSGNVVATKGTIVIRAARVEVRESADGYHTAVAYGSAQQHATFRQKRDVPGEWIEGDGERIEYDSKSEVVRFITSASVRRLRDNAPADEIAGNLVTYDSDTEVFNVSGGAAATPTNPGGRVRVILSPREGSAAALEAAAAAASGASASSVSRTASAASAPRLRSSPTLAGKP